jgi:hypothetical protein
VVNAEDNLAAVWIRFQSLPKKSPEYGHLFWVCERLDDLCRSEPAAAWNVIQEIVALNQSEVILAMLGAGPFEDFDGEPRIPVNLQSGVLRQD